MHHWFSNYREEVIDVLNPRINSLGMLSTANDNSVKKIFTRNKYMLKGRLLFYDI